MNTSQRLAQYAINKSAFDSAEEFSIKIGFGKNTIRNWVNGSVQPKLENVIIALSAVGITLEDALREIK